MTIPPAVPCPDCGETPVVWGDANTLDRPDVLPRLYAACECGMTSATKDSASAAVEAWNEGVAMLRCGEAKAEAARLLSERDEALAEVERLRKSRAYIADKYEAVEAERDELETRNDEIAAATDGCRSDEGMNDVAALLRRRRAERDEARTKAERLRNHPPVGGWKVQNDSLRAQVKDLAYALGQLERLATAVAGDAPTEARYGSLWSDLRKAAAEARKVLDKHDGKTERNES